MPSYAGPSAARPGDVIGTLRLLVYLALSITLVILDYQGSWLNQLRDHASLLVQPLRTVAGWPGQLVQTVRDDAGTRAQLVAENERLRNQALIDSARLTRMQAAAVENTRLRGLLGAVQRGGLDVQLAPILDIDLDPTRQRLVLDAGSRDGVRVGQAVLDAGGLVGQVISVTPGHAIALLLTDPDHAVPVAVARTGVRLVAYGSGRSHVLAVPNIPLSADVKVGDLLVTSGLGMRFPPGFPVGTVTGLQPDNSRAFLVGEVKPAAQLDRGRDVLLLRKPPSSVPAKATDAVTEEVSADTTTATPRTSIESKSKSEPAPETPAPATGDVP